EAPCVPPRNVRQFVEVLLERGDNEAADSILRNYFNCLDAKDTEPRKKIATGLAQLADLYPGPGGDLMACAIRKLGEQICKKTGFPSSSKRHCGWSKSPRIYWEFCGAPAKRRWNILQTASFVVFAAMNAIGWLNSSANWARARLRRCARCFAPDSRARHLPW